MLSNSLNNLAAAIERLFRQPEERMIGNEKFWSWCRKYGYSIAPYQTWRIVKGKCRGDVQVWVPEFALAVEWYHPRLREAERQKLNRYWLAYLNDVPPESPKAHKLAGTKYEY